MARARPPLPKAVKYSLAIVIPLALMPLAMIARSRALPSAKTRIGLLQDMGVQPKYKGQAVAEIFADQRAMRPPVEGTVARGQLHDDPLLEQGKVLKDGKWQWTEAYPPQIEITQALAERGRERFNIYCAVCHGESGYGTGMVHERAVALETPGWIQPASLHSDDLRGRPVGDLFHVISAGVRTMPAYAGQIPVDDRWAIVAYIKALQLSQHAELADVPEEAQRTLK